MLGFVRLAIRGHALGYLLMAASIAAQDAPGYFTRVTPWGFIIPVALVVGIHLLRVDHWVAARLRPMLAAALALIPIGAAFASWLLVLLAFRGVSPSLLSPDAKSLRMTAWVLLVYYGLFGLAALVASVKVSRAMQKGPEGMRSGA
jgi:hypothetical protein